MEPDFRVRVAISATVSPSEDPGKVTLAIMNIVGGLQGELSMSDSGIQYRSDEAKSLFRLREQLRDRRVRAAARRLLTDAKHGRRSEVMLNRQAAAAGVVVLCGSPVESPLGPLYLKIESSELDELIEWLTTYEG